MLGVHEYLVMNLPASAELRRFRRDPQRPRDPGKEPSAKDQNWLLGSTRQGLPTPLCQVWLPYVVGRSWIGMDGDG